MPTKMRVRRKELPPILPFGPPRNQQAQLSHEMISGKWKVSTLDPIKSEVWRFECCCPPCSGSGMMINQEFTFCPINWLDCSMYVLSREPRIILADPEDET